MADYVEHNNLGEMILVPCDVFLDEQLNAVHPDIIFISPAKSKIVQENSSIQGVPDMLIEVLSKGNSDHDTIVKKELHERFGVQEYWFVNPDSALAQGFILQNGKYQSIDQHFGKINSTLLNHEFSF